MPPSPECERSQHMSRMGDTANPTDMANTGGGEDQGNQGQGGAGAAGQVGKQIRDLGQQARQAATEKYDELRGQAQDYYQQAQDYYQQGREKAVEWEQGLEQYIHEKPLQAVLIAAGVGVVLGLLWKRS